MVALHRWCYKKQIQFHSVERKIFNNEKPRRCHGDKRINDEKDSI